MTHSRKTRRPVDDEDDFTRWDETIFDRCFKAGFNPFGSGPTPVFLRQASQKHSFQTPDIRLKNGFDEDDRQ